MKISAVKTWAGKARAGGGAAVVLALAASAPARAQAPLNYLQGYGGKAYPVVALTWGLLAISIAVTVVIAVLVLWGCVARRKRSAFSAFDGEPLEPAGKGLNWITIGVGVSAVPLVVALVWTVVVLVQINEPAGAAPFTIEVTGNQWWWQARYLTDDPARVFSTANEIHIPVGRPVRFQLKGGDVIHSFWVPALTGKTDTIPGQTNVTWLEADQPGRYRGQCTEYCGFQHAHMALYVVADPPAQFQAWWNSQLAPAATPASAQAQQGEALFLVRCGACHAVRGTDAGGRVAPDLTHLMSRQTIAAGAAANTPAGLAGWIANPQGIKPGTLMPTLYLTGPQLAQVSAFLQTLK